MVRPIWTLLPLKVRKSRMASGLKNLAMHVIERLSHQSILSLETGSVRQAGYRVISTLAELDQMLKMLDAAAARSDEELRRGFASFRMDLPMDITADPDSDAYRAQQMELYEWLHGKPYAVSNEVSNFDIAAAADVPFPFHTQSSQTVGNQLIAIGHIIRTLNLKPKSRVLEFGPGWGNTTISMARLGYRVTAVDIEKNFVALIKERARRKNLEIDVVQEDFSVIHKLDQQFDAVLFFECFHHCSNHQSLIAGLDRVVAPGGKVIFAAEPITDDLPIPWGLRLDGESLWAIRQQGWLELGFQETYFRRLLARHGWNVEKSVCNETPWGVIFIATRMAKQSLTTA
jgi:SAM-dependent methyltransferase